MTRPIKFRAWDKKLNRFRWITPETMSYYATNLGSKNFQQYTGLKDRQGVEIYEGDIVLGSDNGEFFPEEYDEKKDEFYPIGKYEVYWADGGWWLKDKDGEPIDCEYNILISPDAELEVLGNIYENPVPKGRK